MSEEDNNIQLGISKKPWTGILFPVLNTRKVIPTVVKQKGHSQVIRAVSKRLSTWKIYNEQLSWT